MSDIDQLLSMGFTKAQITAAAEIKRSNKNVELLDILLRQQASPTKQSDSQILKEYSFDVLTPDQRLRINNMPVGLKNMANVCYLNSLIQTYFHNPIFVREILSFKYPLSLSFEKLLLKNEAKAKRVKSSINLVVHLQKLFAYLVLSDRKYVDPFQVFLNVVDEFGNRFQLGDQKDLAEFNLQFITCLDEGLKYDEDKVQSAEIQVIDNKIAQQQSQRSETTHQRSVILLDEQQTQIIENSQSSIFNSSSQILQNSQSVLTGLFFGKAKEFTQYFQNNEFKESEENEQVFLQIILNIDHKDLYSAWEANSQFQIENYRNNDEVIEPAQKTIWITQIPDSLLFQIQRVGYHPDKGLIKLNAAFTFEKEIYADRFLLENKQKVNDTQSILNQLKKEKQVLEDELSKYQNFQNTNQSILTILNNARQYVSEQKKLIIFDDQEDPILKQIEDCKLGISLIIQQLQSKIDKINIQIEEHYAIMKHHKYNLHSILIHEGAAESGHYYTYIYNPLINKWFKFNDINVTIVPEEKVLKDAFGDGKQKMNAYCLVYVKENKILSSEFTDYTKNCIYSNYIQQNLKEEVDRDNQKFRIELQEHELVQLGDLIVEIYNIQFQQVNEIVRKFKNIKSETPPLNNFSSYLRFQQLSPNFIDSMNDLVKWAILDNAIREASSNQRSLKDFIKCQILHQRIKYHFDQMSQYKVPVKFVIDKQTIKHLKYYFAEYIMNLHITCVKPYLEVIQDKELGDF